MNSCSVVVHVFVNIVTVESSLSDVGYVLCDVGCVLCFKIGIFMVFRRIPLFQHMYFHGNSNDSFLLSVEA